MIELTPDIAYILALTVGLTATIIYGLLMLCSREINSSAHTGYNIAQKIMGSTLLIWALHIATHLLLNTRYTNNYLAATVSLSSYSILISGLELTFHALLDDKFITKRRLRIAILRSVVYSMLLALNYFCLSKSAHNWSIFALALPLAVMIFRTSIRAIKHYNKVKRNVDNYYSDDTSEAVVWLRYSLYIMLALGFACVLIPYGSAVSDSITMIIAVIALTYVVISMRNYAVHITTIFKVADITTEQETAVNEEPVRRLSNIQIQIIEGRIDEWVKEEKFIKPNITIDDLAEDIRGNRRYVSEYLNDNLNLTFKGWIAQLKIEYSKSLLLNHPDYTTSQVAEMIGYSRSNYNKAFAKITGQTPTAYRQTQAIDEATKNSAQMEEFAQ